MGAQARLRENRDFETIISQKHRIMVNSHVQLFNSRGDERLCTKSHLSFQAPASPPDVRQGYALPVAVKKPLGLCPWFGLWPRSLGQSPNQVRSPVALVRVHRQGYALPHIGAAKPVRMTTKIFCLLFPGLDVQTVSHIGEIGRA